MLSQQIKHCMDEEDFERLSKKLEDVLTTDYFYSRHRREVSVIVEEIMQNAYKKGRTDEKYYLYGPSSSKSK